VRRGGRREAAEHRACRRRRVESHADADAWRVAAGWLAAGGGSEGERRASKRGWSGCRFFFWLGWAAWLLASGVASSARGKARLDRDGPGPCASYKG